MQEENSPQAQKSLREDFQRFRELRGWNQIEAAKWFGVSPITLANWETEKRCIVLTKKVRPRYNEMMRVLAAADAEAAKATQP